MRRKRDACGQIRQLLIESGLEVAASRGTEWPLAEFGRQHERLRAHPLSPEQLERLERGVALYHDKACCFDFLLP